MTVTEWGGRMTGVLAGGRQRKPGFIKPAEGVETGFWVKCPGAGGAFALGGMGVLAYVQSALWRLT